MDSEIKSTIGSSENQRNVVSSKLFNKTTHDKGVSALFSEDDLHNANTRSPSPWDKENTEQSLISNQEHVDSKCMKATGKIWSNLKVAENFEAKETVSNDVNESLL